MLFIKQVKGQETFKEICLIYIILIIKEIHLVGQVYKMGILNIILFIKKERIDTNEGEWYEFNLYYIIYKECYS